MDVPVALGILITFVTSTGATFEPGGLFGDEVYFDSMTMFVSFLLGGTLPGIARPPAGSQPRWKARWRAARDRLARGR
jgi:cation transport ATPase